MRQAGPPGRPTAGRVLETTLTPAPEPSRAPGASQSLALAPSLLAVAGPEASARVLEFLTARIRNRHTRDAYARAIGRFLLWTDRRGLRLEQLSPVAVAAYVEELGTLYEPSSVKQHLAALRMVGDYLVTGGHLPVNPAAAVRGPRLVVRTGKTPAFTADEARQVLEAIGGDALIDLRDRALLSVMLYALARVSAAVGLRVADYEGERRRAWLILREKGGQWRRVPVHSSAAAAVDRWLEASGLREQGNAPLFPTFRGRSGELTVQPLSRRDALRIVQQRCRAAGLRGRFSNHSLRATGITAFLEGGGTLEAAAELAGHASTQTTQLYDRRRELVHADDIERIRI